MKIMFISLCNALNH